MEGYIKLHRKLLEWEWYQDGNVFRIFIHCLLRANHKERKWQGIKLAPGEFITSYQNIANELSKKNSTFTVMQVRTAIKKLIVTGEITIKTTNKFTIVKVKNRDAYQIDNTQNNNQITNKQQTNNNQITTDKNEKNNTTNRHVEINKNKLLEYKNNKLMLKLIDILENCNIEQHIDTKKAILVYDYFIEKAKEYKFIKLIGDRRDTTGMEIMFDKFRLYYEKEKIKNIKSTFLNWLTKQVGKTFY